jgi:hypothetical protein
LADEWPSASISPPPIDWSCSTIGTEFGLLPHTQTAMIAAHELADHHYEGIATGRKHLNAPPQGTPEKVAVQTHPNITRAGADMVAWPALLRKLDRINPSFGE